MTTSRKHNADIDIDMILSLLLEENEDSVVTEGTDTDDSSDETVSGIEENGSNGGADVYDGEEGNIVQATQQIARPNLRNPK
jgi:hypothetical protein